MSNTTWKKCWNRLNSMLAHDCSEGIITEEQMERLLDHASLCANTDELIGFCEDNEYEIVKPREKMDEFDDEWNEGSL